MFFVLPDTQLATEGCLMPANVANSDCEIWKC